MSGVLSIRGFVFDMDGLLLDTERVALECWHAAEQDVSIPLPEGFYFSIIGQSIKRIEARLHGLVDDPERIRAYLDVANRNYQLALHEGEIPRKPGAERLLAWLREARVPVCLATSTHRALAEEKLTRAGLKAYLGKSVCGDEVRDSKPDPEIYLEAARRLGIDPSGLLAFEDSENGLRAALAAGLRTAHVPDIAPVSVDVQVRTDRIYPSLTAVLDAIKRGEFRFV